MIDVSLRIVDLRHQQIAFLGLLQRQRLLQFVERSTVIPAVIGRLRRVKVLLITSAAAVPGIVPMASEGDNQHDRGEQRRQCRASGDKQLSFLSDTHFDYLSPVRSNTMYSYILPRAGRYSYMESICLISIKVASKSGVKPVSPGRTGKQVQNRKIL